MKKLNILLIIVVSLVLLISCKNNHANNKYFQDIYFSQLEDVRFYYASPIHTKEETEIKNEIPLSIVAKKIAFNCMQTALEIPKDNVPRTGHMNIGYIKHYLSISVDKKTMNYRMFNRHLFYNLDDSHFLRINDACYKFFVDLYKENAEKSE